MRKAIEALTVEENGELHDFHECRAYHLYREARDMAPELAAQEQWHQLRQL